MLALVKRKVFLSGPKTDKIKFTRELKFGVFHFGVLSYLSLANLSNFYLLHFGVCVCVFKLRLQ